MDEAAITRYIATELSGVDLVVASREGGAPEIAWGDAFFIYDPDRDLDDVRRFPFATIVTKDYGDFDNASNLDRPGVFRLNIGVSKDTFATLFGTEGEYDFAALDRIMPHPVAEAHLRLPLPASPYEAYARSALSPGSLG